jgi:hypothetical protein
MDRFNRLIEFSSASFPRNPRDAELVNAETMHGYALSRYIGLKLYRRGTLVNCYVGEDWGWYCEIRDKDFALAYGVLAENDSEDFFDPVHPAQDLCAQAVPQDRCLRAARAVAGRRFRHPAIRAVDEAAGVDRGLG